MIVERRAFKYVYDMKKALFIFISCLATSAFSETSLPKLKAGGWEIQSENSMLPKPMTYQFCIDEATQDKLFSQASQQNTHCSKPEVTKDGSSYVMKTSCEMAGRKTDMINTSTFDGDSAFTSNMQMISDGRTHTMKSTGKHVGDCLEGMTPGDMKIAGMDMTFNPSTNKMTGLSPKDIAALAKQFQKK